MPDFVVINTSYKSSKINANCFGGGCELVASPNFGDSTFFKDCRVMDMHLVMPPSGVT